MSADMLELARLCVAIGKSKGAQEVAAAAGKSREVEVQWRDGKLEKLTEATSRSVGLQLYIDGRYSSVTTSDLRRDALERFIEDAVALTRTLTPDPHRTLPDPKLYEGQAKIDLQLEDKAHGTVSAERRLETARQLEDACRIRAKADVLSITTGWSDVHSEGARVHSNGFEGTRAQTSYWISAQVSLKDKDGRRPEESGFAGARFAAELPSIDSVAAQAMDRVQGRLGAIKPPSAKLPLILENRSAGRILGAFLGPLAGASLQQKRSMFEGKLGQAVAHPMLTLVDEPLLVRGFGSRLFDGEGIAAKRMPVIEQGVLTNYYIDTYYGKKLGMAPTTGGTSNLDWSYGNQDLRTLMRDVSEAILVTGFLGGNSNSTTGDFSFGVYGFRVRGGERAESVGELNIAGNHMQLWQQLLAVGNDPYSYSAYRTPTLVFDAVQFAGA